jgi:hypothetical protein
MLRRYIIITEWNSDTIISVSVLPSNRKEPHYSNNGGGVNGLEYEIHDYSLEDAVRQISPQMEFEERDPTDNYCYEG